MQKIKIGVVDLIIQKAFLYITVLLKITHLDRCMIQTERKTSDGLIK